MSDETENVTRPPVITANNGGPMKYLPLISMIGVLVLQTLTFTWHASKMSSNQEHIKEDTKELKAEIKEIKKEQQNRKELVYSVKSLEKRVLEIEQWIKENKFTFNDLERRLRAIEKD